ncbi:BlaI/MecI/CopY family transcriptional regulator [Hoeflea prorocentri]|uniref:BlaI/MecI/CopY family transcriptional regulator n=1 Tax=Hoeflea prorocentri TaxID=1922333 RepID=A0A9X3UL79_9HYPH|nr:BlaI/MecI/CopY family transcriptional regulator [Hoeflea prorocentri]MCY6383313.1 BlaI/MecI/CopY family transcriptional regulator [Hoeflea prorocentri]MDA5401113.1 BlaI/MecI/CopY family transcriptional regulator [Hoeflea prorocentri]
MQPSPSELPLLKALWSNSELSARELHEKIADELGWSLSSTRKTIDRMIEKGLVTADERHGIKVYRAAVDKISTLAGLTRQFARAVLEIDGPLPASSFTGSRILSSEELDELQRFLDEEADR